MTVCDLVTGECVRDVRGFWELNVADWVSVVLASLALFAIAWWLLGDAKPQEETRP